MKSASLYFAVALLLASAGCRRTPTVESLLSEDSAVRDKSIARLIALPDSKKEPLVKPLIAALGNDDPRISQRAGKALVTIGAGAVPELVQSLRDGGLFLKLSSLETLGQMGPIAGPAVEELIAATKHEHPLVRAEAVAALGALNGPQPEAVAAAKSLLKDKDSGVREAAERTINKLSGANARAEIDKHTYKTA